MKHFITALAITIACAPALARIVHSHKGSQHKVIPFTTPESYLIADSNGTTIKEQDSELQRPIASISKLMVGLLASTQDLREELVIPRTRTVNSSIPYKQKTLTRQELLTLALVKSDNFAAQILCENIPNCINAMNSKAQELGMAHTYYEEPTGLSKNNVSTATDLLKLLMAASSNMVITSLSSLPMANIDTGGKTISIRNTNPLTAKLDILLSKTGFTNPAGQCLVMGVRSPAGIRYFILLGSKHRIPEMEKLYKDVS